MKKYFFYIASFLLGLSSFAQTPNASFETWSSGTPEGWTTTLIPFSGNSATKVNPGKSGAACIKITSKKNYFLDEVIPGFAITGDYDMINEKTGGFPFTSRPKYLNGSFKYVPTENDSCLIAVQLLKWNSFTQEREVIALYDTIFSSMNVNWTNFSLPLFYYGNEIPDSASIIFMSSALEEAKEGSALSIDDLAFSETKAGVHSMEKRISTVSVYPNPASDCFTVELSNEMAGAKIQLYDVLGNLVYEQQSASVVNNTIDVHALSKGNYFVKITSVQGIETQKIVIQ